MVGTQLQMGGTAVDVKARRPWTIAVLSIVTLGIYSTVCYYKINREMRDFGSARGDHDLARSRPWRSVLAITIGGLIVIPALVSLVATLRRVQAVEREASGSSGQISALTALVVGSQLLSLGQFVGGIGVWFGLIGCGAYLTAIVLVQVRLNAAWYRGGALVRNERRETVTTA
jgi:hypothetical protein